MVPHLITSLTGPINELEQRVLESMPAIERWFRLEWMEHTPPFYCAVDLRNAGFKLAPVDTKLHPDGFNNLTDEMLPLAVQATMAAIEKICPEAKNLLLVPRLPNGDSFYLANLQRLVQIFSLAGLNVRVGAPAPAGGARLLALPGGDAVRIERLQRKRGRLVLDNFDPCTIVLNSDLADGVPRELEGLYEQYLLPPLHAGATARRKSNHFRSYEELAKKFGKLLGMDHWLIAPMFGQCGQVDLGVGEGMECVRSNADALLTKIRRKYKSYGINEKPFVIVKADSGAGGKGILTVRDAADLNALGDKAQRDAKVTEVIIQEGVPTHERVNAAVAEPVVYMIDRYVVGGFYRVHAERGIDEALNAPGAGYVPLAFDQSHLLPKPGERPGASSPNRFYLYGVIARLAMLAAAYELEATDPDAEVYD